jgi:broad specificity phosphatase PhoE
MIVYLLRHAESDNNQLEHENKSHLLKQMKDPDPQITAKGIKQANNCQALLSKIQKSGNTIIWTSGLQRTHQTAHHAMPTEHILVKKIIELNEWGENESRAKFINRIDDIFDWIDDEVENNKYDNLVIIGHSRFFSMMCTRLFSADTHTKLYAEFPNCSMSAFEVTNLLQKKIYRLADISHLQSENVTGNYLCV